MLYKLLLPLLLFVVCSGVAKRLRNITHVAHQLALGFNYTIDPSNDSYVFAEEERFHVDDIFQALPPKVLAEGIVYVQMPPLNHTKQMTFEVQSASKGAADEVINGMSSFIPRMSRNRFHLIGSWTTEMGKTTAQLMLRYIEGAWSHVPIIGNIITARHEIGHLFKMGHAHERFWTTQTKLDKVEHQREPFCTMTRTPSRESFNAGHLHFLNWFGPHEEAYLTVGQTYTLRRINDGNTDYTSLKALFYPVPNSLVKFWFSYVELQAKGSWGTSSPMNGNGIAVHSGPGVFTYLEAVIGHSSSKTLLRSGLVPNIESYTETTVTLSFSLDPNWVCEICPL